MSRLVFDIGGTNMRLAFAEDGIVGSIEKTPTPKDPEEVVTRMQAFVTGHAVEEIVGGIAGIVKDGTIIDAPNLSSWNGFSLGEALREVFKVPAHVYNDAEIAGIGEATSGAGAGYARVGYLTIGTGVGGALVVAGSRIDGSEPGRLVLQSGQALESRIGGAALAAEFGTSPELLPQTFYDERTPVLAEGVRALVDLWNPDIFILNGPLVYGTPAFRIEALAAAIGESVPLVPASFRDQSGLQGAALVARR